MPNKLTTILKQIEERIFDGARFIVLTLWKDEVESFWICDEDMIPGEVAYRKDNEHHVYNGSFTYEGCIIEVFRKVYPIN